MRVPMVAVLLVIGTGCLGGGDDASSLDVADGLALGPLSGLPLSRDASSLDRPPVFALGEWWTYRLSSSLFGAEETFTLVAAGVDGTSFLLGYPMDAEPPGMPFIEHLPGTGELAITDLTYDAHDAPFKLLDFPLVEGRTWEGEWWSFVPMTVTVDAVDGTTATLSIESDAGPATYTYDAAMGAITSWERSLADGTPDFTMELSEHGFGHEGPVRVPYGQDLLFCHGNALVVLGIADCANAGPSAPRGTVEVPEGYDVATVALVIQPSRVEGQDAPQATTIQVTDPNGGQRSGEVLPGDQGLLDPFSVEQPTGTWTYEVVAGSGGAAIVEGVVYRAFDVELPSGCWLSEPPPEAVGAVSCA